MGLYKSSAMESIPGTAIHHQIWLPKTHIILRTIIIVLFLSPVYSEDFEHSTQRTEPVYGAICNITYIDPNTNISVSEKYEGRFGNSEAKKDIKIKIEKENGRVVLVRTIDNNHNGCKDFDITIPTFKWVALMTRGDCSFDNKIERAKKNNASAVVIINDDKDMKDAHVMGHTVEGIVAVSLNNRDGQKIMELIEKGTNVTMYINVGVQVASSEDKGNPSKTSVVFVSVSFIVLMIISLAWLVFYYIQRFRYAHAKERLARRLASAAKKAIAKIPQKTVKNGDKEMSADFDQCAVCIEGYKAHDVIRTLPCKHVFHKSCVDPWLLDQRSCPMCKLDILRAYGMHVGGSEDSVHPDGESGNAISPVEDMEQTSVGDEQSADGEVKVLLLPQHVCLHHGGESSRDGRSSIDSSHATCDPSEECVHSSDSECTELHSLMDHIGAAGGPPCTVPTSQKDSDTEDLSV